MEMNRKETLNYVMKIAELKKQLDISSKRHMKQKEM
jgi:hypothetical protein